MEKTSSEKVVVLYAAAIVSFDRKPVNVAFSRSLADEIDVDEAFEGGG